MLPALAQVDAGMMGGTLKTDASSTAQIRAAPAHEGDSSSSSSSTSSSEREPPLTPELQLEIAKELIFRFAMAQENRMLSAHEESLIKFIKGRVPALEAAVGVRGGGHHSPRTPALQSEIAHAAVGQQVITRHSAEEDDHATSGAHNKMSDANVSHEQHTGHEFLSSDHESFSAKRNSGCDPAIQGFLLKRAVLLLLQKWLHHFQMVKIQHNHQVFQFVGAWHRMLRTVMTWGFQMTLEFTETER